MNKLEVDCLILSIEEKCIDAVTEQDLQLAKDILDMISEVRYKPLLKPTKCNNK